MSDDGDAEDIGAKAQAWRDGLYRHIGYVVRNAASLEQEVAVLITALVDSRAPFKVRPLVQGRRLSELIDTLKLVMPDYPEKGNLVKALRAVNAHRDRLAHSTTGFEFGGKFNWDSHWIDRQSRATQTSHRLDSADFPAVERDHYLVGLIVNQLMSGLMFSEMDGVEAPDSIAEVMTFADSKMQSGIGPVDADRIARILTTGGITAGFTDLP